MLLILYSKLEKITNVNLFNFYINLQLILLLSIELIKNHGIENFNISHNDIADDGAEALYGALQSSVNTLKYFAASNNKIGPRGAISFIHRLGLHNNVLQYLDLSWNVIGDDGAEALAKMLESNSIRKLDIRSNGISKFGAECLAKSLEY